jgi:hypothetical protein
MRKIILLFIPIIFWGCATVLGSDQQWINFSTQCSTPAEPASCVAFNDRGRWEIQTPSKVKILKSSSDLTVVCGDAPTGEYRYTVASQPNVLTVGNAIIGGGIGILQDLKSANAFDYPDNVSLPGPTCAFNGSAQTITVAAQCKGRPMNTVCEAMNERGRWRFETPATFQVGKSPNDLRISCQGGLLGDYRTKISATDEAEISTSHLINATVADKKSSGYVKYRYPARVTLEAPLCKMF